MKNIQIKKLTQPIHHTKTCFVRDNTSVLSSLLHGDLLQDKQWVIKLICILLLFVQVLG